jgi:hypothetical protein
MTPIASLIAARAAVAVAIAAGSIALSSGDAKAVSLRVKLACAGDYYRHCSAYSPGGPEVRQCMRSVGRGLSRGCVNALYSAGEMSSKDLARYNASTRTASR